MAVPSTSDLAAVISAVSSLGSFFVVGATAWIAYNQLISWRQEAILKKRADVSERALVVLARIDDGLRAVRSPLDRVPADQIGEKGIHLKRRMERIANLTPLFTELHECQVAVATHIDNKEVDEAFEEVFEIRREIILAIEFLFDELDSDDNDDSDLLERKAQWRRIYSGFYSERDQFGLRQINAVALIQRELRPLARYALSNT